MKIEVIEKPDEKLHHDGSCGQSKQHPELDELEKHPDVLKHKPKSIYGEVYLSKFDSSEYYTWIKPVSGGTYESTNPIFKIAVDYKSILLKLLYELTDGSKVYTEDHLGGLDSAMKQIDPEYDVKSFPGKDYLDELREYLKIKIEN